MTAVLMPGLDHIDAEPVALRLPEHDHGHTDARYAELRALDHAASDRARELLDLGPCPLGELLGALRRAPALDRRATPRTTTTAPREPRRRRTTA